MQSLFLISKNLQQAQKLPLIKKQIFHKIILQTQTKFVYVRSEIQWLKT